MKKHGFAVAVSLALAVRASWPVSCLALALCASCSSDSDSDGGSTSFTGFVQHVVADTSDTSEPVDVNGASFSFSEDPAAFDNLFQ